jgi:hypothetical protein|tara:strand:- start:5140 stop:5451 length:312 start_codon:yes stop_codon:yes gene_type:complete
MAQLLWFVLAAFGLTQILVYGAIMKWNKETPFKWINDLFACPMCTGFWVGVILFFLNPFTELFTFEYNLANLLVCGWLSSGTSYVLCMLFDDDGFKITRKEQK